MAVRLKMYLIKSLRELTEQPADQLLSGRYQKFRQMGRFLAADSDDPSTLENGRP
jgi:acetyl-CoA carboxylase carboxyl transferase subunit alpha